MKSYSKRSRLISSVERRKKIEACGQAFEMLDAAINRIPIEAWHHRPAPDRWTFHEIIIHITDSKANSYVRCRRFIAEPAKDRMAYDENQWSKALNYAG